jgi:TolB-like protein
MMTFDEAKTILAALEREGVRYVLVGSMGMAAQGVRASRDIDSSSRRIPKTSTD